MVALSNTPISFFWGLARERYDLPNTSLKIELIWWMGWVTVWRICFFRRVKIWNYGFVRYFLIVPSYIFANGTSCTFSGFLPLPPWIFLTNRKNWFWNSLAWDKISEDFLVYSFWKWWNHSGTQSWLFSQKIYSTFSPVSSYHSKAGSLIVVYLITPLETLLLLYFLLSLLIV
jgi:hypothetical protein